MITYEVVAVGLDNDSTVLEQLAIFEKGLGEPLQGKSSLDALVVKMSLLKHVEQVEYFVAHGFVWDCFDDHSRWKEAIDLLIEKLSHYELIVCFTPQNLSTTLLRHEIIQNQTVGYKIFNLFEVLQQSNFYHPAIKRGLTLQRLETALFSDAKLFEHSRILLEATSNDLISYQQAREDLITENEIVAKTYQLFFK